MPTMKDLLTPITEATTKDDADKANAAAAKADDAAKADAKKSADAAANAALTESGPVCEIAADQKSVTVFRAGSTAPVVEVIPTADSVKAPLAKAAKKHEPKPPAPAAISPAAAGLPTTAPVKPMPIPKPAPAPVPKTDKTEKSWYDHRAKRDDRD